MTEKLYHAAHAALEADAMVRACTKERDGFHVVLDRTPLYPEGGGQLSDTGMMGKATVSAAYEQGGEVVHIVSEAFEAGRRNTSSRGWRSVCSAL